jgi:hypothetical protein
MELASSLLSLRLAFGNFPGIVIWHEEGSEPAATTSNHASPKSPWTAFLSDDIES